MRILHLVFNRVGQGTYWRSLNFARCLVELGHSVTVVATAPTNRLRLEETWVDGVHLIQAPDLFGGSLRSGWDLWNAWRRIVWLQKESFDLVHAFECRPTVLLPMLYLRKWKQMPVVLDWADWFGKGGSVEQRPNPLVRLVLRPVETFFEERFRAQSDATTVICSTLAQKAISLGIPESQIFLIHNGCSTRDFEPQSQADARRQVGLAVEGIVIGYVGSIFKPDFDFMNKVFNTLVERSPDVRLVVAGYFPYNLRSVSKFPQAVIQTGPLDRVRLNAFLSACDIFWLPFHNSNANRGRWPIKLNDYMAVGRPCVATAVGDVETLMKSEQIGLLCTDDVPSMVEQTIHLIEHEALRIKLGNNARQLAETKWNWIEKTKQLESIYDQVTR